MAWLFPKQAAPPKHLFPPLPTPFLAWLAEKHNLNEEGRKALLLLEENREQFPGLRTLLVRSLGRSVPVLQQRKKERRLLLGGVVLSGALVSAAHQYATGRPYAVHNLRLGTLLALPLFFAARYADIASTRRFLYTAAYQRRRLLVQHHQDLPPQTLHALLPHPLSYETNPFATRHNLGAFQGRFRVMRRAAKQSLGYYALASPFVPPLAFSAVGAVFMSLALHNLSAPRHITERFRKAGAEIQKLQRLLSQTKRGN